MKHNYVGMVSRSGKIIVRLMDKAKVADYLDSNPLIAFGFDWGECKSQEEAEALMRKKLAQALR